ncbi:21657_t:CDS:2 [Gigaspora rosea]|nr:21657_t:CDS:2 [Gigaspora rosea]
MALQFGTIEQQDVSASLRGFLQNWQNWQQNQHNQDNLKIPQKQNNTFSFEIFETRKEIVTLQCPCKDCIERKKFADNSAKRNTEIKEEKDEVYEHIKKVEKQIYDIFKEYERINNNFRNPQIDDYLNQQEELQSTFTEEEEEIRSHYTFSSEDIEEINKPWRS